MVESPYVDCPFKTSNKMGHRVIWRFDDIIKWEPFARNFIVHLFFLSFLMEWLLTFALSNKQRAHAPSRRSIRSCYYSRMDFFHISTDWEKALSLILVAKTWRIIHRMEMSFCASKMHASDILILCIWENALSMWAQKNSSKNLRFTYLRANQFKNFVFPL